MLSASWKLPIVLIAAILMSSASVLGQDPQPTAPAAVTPLQYQVYEVKGRVYMAKIGVDPKLRAGWTRVQKGQFLSEGQQVRVSSRSAVKLAAIPADPPTVILIEKLSLVSISELRFENGAAKARIGLGYGAIRVGVAEGAVRSDMEISCPVATLSKKGTDIFRFEYRNGRWKMSLSELGRGQIQALQILRSGIGGARVARTRNVFPGQAVTDMMARTIETTMFDRNINVNDLFGLQGIELQLNALFGTGLNLLFKGRNPIELRESVERDQDTVTTSTMTGQTLQQGDSGQLQLQQAINRLRAGSQIFGNSAGDFGIGQGTIDVFSGFLGKSRRNDLARTCRTGMLRRHITGCTQP